MARNKSTVYIGYEDEDIVAKHINFLNSTVNKVGGVPFQDWPCSEIKVSVCQLCGIARPLILQLYAPLEKSQFHRTLYIFACLNPSCSQNAKSWTCIRTQHLDTCSYREILSCNNSSAVAKNLKNKTTVWKKISWCSGTEEWDTTEEMDLEVDIDPLDFRNRNEENGNVIEKNDNSAKHHVVGVTSSVSDGEEEDDDDESNSIENDLACSFGQLDADLSQNMNVEDPNANCASGISTDIGISTLAGAQAISTICAEIEGGESDVVFVETPKKPERDLIALLKHTETCISTAPLAKITDITLKSFFISVDIESKHQHDDVEQYSGALSIDHIRDLYLEYKRQDEKVLPSNSGGTDVDSIADVVEQEHYEKSFPAHGDTIFHEFSSTFRRNPGQILRYSRDTLPKLIAPLTEPMPNCAHCNSETICELQILPTLISKLQFQHNRETAPIEFGNILIFTCLKSCWDTPDKMRFEKVIVQEEK